MIDNFDHGMSWNFPDDGDGRVGTWEHEYWDFTTPDVPGRLFSEPVCGDEAGCMGGGMGGASGQTPGYLVAACNGAGEQGWCEATWSESNPWGQWAAVSTRLTQYSETDVNCYNAAAGGFMGVEFMAKSPSSDKILLQAVDPSADAEQGWTYKSPVITLTTEWDTYQVPFSDIVMPTWVGDLGGPSGSVDASALIALSFVIRSVTYQMSGTGESLNAYEIHIDDVSFY
jgi:hypothetical protein